MKIHRPNFRVPGGLASSRRVLLSKTVIIEQTAATIDLSLPSGYDYFEFWLRDFRMTVDDVAIRVQFGTADLDFVIDANYDWAIQRSSLAGAAVSSGTDENSIAISPDGVALGIGNNTNEGFNSEVIFHNPQGEASYPMLHSLGAFMDAAVATNLSHVFTCGELKQFIRVDRITFFPSNGNFTNGTLYHYGVTGGNTI